ncbi:MAG TPA: hypothetical protein VG917_03625 [Patescibacteria group bacterium]|nr:hypothetical protein [Patescibacteria group bacterium]
MKYKQDATQNPDFGAMYYAVTKKDFVRTVAMLSSPNVTSSISEEYGVDHQVWISIGKIIEASDMD